jgi:hypothetical protein
MRTDSGTEEDNIYHVLFTWILDKYGKYLHMYTRQIWQWDSTLESASGGLPYSVSFSVVYILVPTILPHNKILAILLHFGRTYLSSAGIFGFINSIQSILLIDRLLRRSTWRLLECFSAITERVTWKHWSPVRGPPLQTGSTDYPTDRSTDYPYGPPLRTTQTIK